MREIPNGDNVQYHECRGEYYREDLSGRMDRLFPFERWISGRKEWQPVPADEASEVERSGERLLPEQLPRTIRLHELETERQIREA